jgi:hypothetical protein
MVHLALEEIQGNDSPPEHLGVNKEYNVDMVPRLATT